jgi:hypothetical protein
MELVAGIRHDLRGIGQELDRSAGRSLGRLNPPPPGHAVPRGGGPIIAPNELAQLKHAVASHWQVRLVLKRAGGQAPPTDPPHTSC